MTRAAVNSRIRPADLIRLGLLGLRVRRLRAALSALGIAIGIAAVVAVLGITRSSQAALLAQIDRLGTNLLTVANGRTIGGQVAELPASAATGLARTDGVTAVTPTAVLPAVRVYRTDKVPPYLTGGIDVIAADSTLPATLDARLQSGVFLNAATEHYPVAVLGHYSATVLGVTAPGQQIWLAASGHGQWFTVAGILQAQVLAPELDQAVLIGGPAAATGFGYDEHPSLIYIRASTDTVAATAARLALAADPETPGEVAVSRPSDVLTARVAARASGTQLFLGLGAVALLVGGIGIANVMVVSVLERRGEIGLRRALGAGRRHIAGQFLLESQALALLGGAGGVLMGIAATATVARIRNWTILIPGSAVGTGLAAAAVIGAAAGLYPALRAAALAPTTALRSSE
ncbi:ABC transporter permease [Catenulispora rubra]|uniref:ABC transporter permease n=1 Tax=Catenulispora rubra TaxID=280293 RepID=UPI0018921383|nr:ABC transporter permease [Catenulispora rubra]